MPCNTGNSIEISSLSMSVPAFATARGMGEMFLRTPDYRRIMFSGELEISTHRLPEHPKSTFVGLFVHLQILRRRLFVQSLKGS